MRAKLFDPFSEDAVNDWLATMPVKAIYSASVFDTTIDGRSRQAALVFYEEEHAVGYEPSSSPPSPRSVLEELQVAFKADSERG